VSVKPLIPGAVLSRIWEIYRDQFAVLVGTALVLFAVQFAVILLVPGASIAALILFWALATLYQGMVVKLVQDVQDGRREHSVGALLASVEPVLLRLMAVSVLFAIGVAIGFVLFIIPGLILLTLWSVVAPVTVLERPGVFAAFGRSRELVRGNAWAVFGVIFVVYVIVLLISLVSVDATASIGSLGRALVQWAVNSATAPVSALSASVLYFALRGEDVPQ
jgi:ABC-type multidrug transport system fused ATPase/permease subunit